MPVCTVVCSYDETVQKYGGGGGGVSNFYLNDQS